MHARRRQRGFSLIEIVIAIGVASFAIVAILGLLSVSFSTEKASAEDTEMALVAGRLLSELRNRPFDEMLEDLDGDWSSPIFLSDDGTSVPDKTKAVYRGLFRYTADADTMPPSGRANLVRVRLELAVAHAPATAENTKVFYACLARH